MTLNAGAARLADYNNAHKPPATAHEQPAARSPQPPLRRAARGLRRTLPQRPRKEPSSPTCGHIRMVCRCRAVELHGRGFWRTASALSFKKSLPMDGWVCPVARFPAWPGFLYTANITGQPRPRAAAATSGAGRPHGPGKGGRRPRTPGLAVRHGNGQELAATPAAFAAHDFHPWRHCSWPPTLDAEVAGSRSKWPGGSAVCHASGSRDSSRMSRARNLIHFRTPARSLGFALPHALIAFTGPAGL